MSEPTIKNYSMKLLYDRPIAYWTMDQASGTFIDSSGLGRDLTLSGVTHGHPPLVVGGKSARFTSAASTSTTLDTILINGREAYGFTLEVWFSVEAPPTGDRLIMGRTGSGLYLTPRGIEFRVMNTELVTTVAAFPVGYWLAPFHVAATYGGGRIYLYVNGELVAGSDFEGGFGNEDDEFYVGGTGGPTIIIDEAAVYTNNLVGQTLRSHYEAGIAAPSVADLVHLSGGTYWPLIEDRSSVVYEYIEETDEQFMSGTRANVFISNGRMMLNDESVAGYKITTPLDIDVPDDIAGSIIEWQASDLGITVDVSLNMGTTWTPAVNGGPIPGLSSIDPTDVLVQVRINFPVVDQSVYDSFFSRLRVAVYDSKDVLASNVNSTAVVSDEVVLPESVGLTSESGARLNGGTIVLTAVDAEALEFWVRRDSATTIANLAGIFTTTASIGTTYVNANAHTPTSADFPRGEWVNVMVNFTAPFNGTITFGPANISIAHPAIYKDTLSVAEIDRHYRMGRSEDALTETEDDLIGVNDLGGTLYSLIWQTVSA